MRHLIASHCGLTCPAAQQDLTSRKVASVYSEDASKMLLLPGNRTLYFQRALGHKPIIPLEIGFSRETKIGPWGLKWEPERDSFEITVHSQDIQAAEASLTIGGFISDGDQLFRHKTEDGKIPRIRLESGKLTTMFHLGLHAESFKDLSAAAKSSFENADSEVQQGYLRDWIASLTEEIPESGLVIIPPAYEGGFPLEISWGPNEIHEHQFVPGVKIVPKSLPKLKKKSRAKNEPPSFYGSRTRDPATC